jgi:hypothetical protein
VAASVATAAPGESTGSTTYTGLTTAGPSVTLTVPATGKILVSVAASMIASTSSTQCYTSYAVSGGSTVAAVDLNAVTFTGGALSRASAASELTGLTPGSTITVTAQYRSGGPGTCTYNNRTIIVLPLP